MDDPVTCGLLAELLLHQCLPAAEKLHGEFVVRRLEQRFKLMFEKTRFMAAGYVNGRKLMVRGSFLHSCLFFWKTVHHCIVTVSPPAKPPTPVSVVHAVRDVVLKKGNNPSGHHIERDHVYRLASAQQLAMSKLEIEVPGAGYRRQLKVHLTLALG